MSDEETPKSFSEARSEIAGDSWADDLARASLSAAEAKFGGPAETHVCLGENEHMPMLRADTDKRHRCPACWSVVSFGDKFPWKREDGIRIRWWRSYRCACCGQRFARWPWLSREHPDPEAAPASGEEAGEQPVIDMGYLSLPADLQAAIERPPADPPGQQPVTGEGS